MGNQFKPLPIEIFINKELKKKLELKKEIEDELKQLCMTYSYNRQEFMPENSFKYILQLSDSEKFNLIFDIFGREIEKKEKIITFADIKYLFFSFQTPNPKIKAILFSFLLFGNKKALSFNEVNNYICKIFTNDIKTSEFLSTLFSKPNKENFEIKEIINFLKEQIFFQDFKFIKEIQKASKCKLISNDFENINYICDCSDNEGDNNNPLNSMRRAYDSLAGNKFLLLNIFKDKLKEEQIHSNITKLVIDYLKKITLKDYCYFNDIKYIFTYLNYSLPLDDKKKFLFKMLLIIYNQEKELTYSQIEKYLNINYEEKKDKENPDGEIKYNEIQFLNDEKIAKLINVLNPFLEDFGLLPYSIFKVKTDDKKIKRRLINDILKNEDINNFEKYIEKNFEDYEYFYAIDIKFWNTLINENEEAPDFIDNSNIAEEFKIVKEEDKIEEEIMNIENEKREKNKKENSKIKKENGKEESNIKEGKKKIEENNNNKGNENNDKEVKKENTQNQEPILKLGKLKKGLKYKKDFILVCGKLYQIFKTHYKMNYIIRLIKLENVIDLESNTNKKEKKNNEKVDNEQK